MENPARLFNCVRCHQQSMICSYCDRGNIYCSPKCSEQARQEARHSTGQRYQNSHRGRRMHAARQHRYRQRQKEKAIKVTHQGSPIAVSSDLLPMALNEPTTSATALINSNQCHFCGKGCAQFVRTGFMQRHLRYQTRTSSWPNGP